MKNGDDTWFKEVFTEFYKLDYTREYKSKRVVVSKGLSDHKVLDYVILRVMPTENVIYYLYNGSSIHIPEKWIDLFSSFNTHSGFRVFECYDSDVDGIISRLGFLMTDLVCHLDRSLSVIEGEKLLEILGEISVIGTKEFREWCLEEFGLELDPLEYRSLDENLNI